MHARLAPPVLALAATTTSSTTNQLEALVAAFCRSSTEQAAVRSVCSLSFEATSTACSTSKAGGVLTASLLGRRRACVRIGGAPWPPAACGPLHRHMGSSAGARSRIIFLGTPQAGRDKLVCIHVEAPACIHTCSYVQCNFMCTASDLRPAW